MNVSTSKEFTEVKSEPRWLRGLWATGSAALAASFVIDVVLRHWYLGVLGVAFALAMVFLSAGYPPKFVGARWFRKTAVVFIASGFVVLLGARIFLALT